MIEPNLDTAGSAPLIQRSGCERAVFCWVLVATAGMQLRDSLDTNGQGLQLLADDAVTHTPAQVLHQKPHTAVLREYEGVEAHSLPHRGTAER